MSDTNAIIENIFTPFQEYITAEQDIREDIRNVVKDIEKSVREIGTVLQVIHRTSRGEEVSAACVKARELFDEVKTGFEKLDQIIPEGQYYRYHDHWRFATQRLCFLAALVVFLEAGFLVDKLTTAQILGLHEKKHLQLDLEDYLMGVLNLATELSRFAVNSVTFGDYDHPLRISKFVAELNAGFRLLNLKNDSLRKRFDALKYDVKKIEEVVYDLTLRGLAPGSGNAAQAAD